MGVPFPLDPEPALRPAAGGDRLVADLDIGQGLGSLGVGRGRDDADGARGIAADAEVAADVEQEAVNAAARVERQGGGALDDGALGDGIEAERAGREPNRRAARGIEPPGGPAQQGERRIALGVGGEAVQRRRRDQSCVSTCTRGSKVPPLRACQSSQASRHVEQLGRNGHWAQRRGGCLPAAELAGRVVAAEDGAGAIDFAEHAVLGPAGGLESVGPDLQLEGGPHHVLVIECEVFRGTGRPSGQSEQTRAEEDRGEGETTRHDEFNRSSIPCESGSIQDTETPPGFPERPALVILLLAWHRLSCSIGTPRERLMSDVMVDEIVRLFQSRGDAAYVGEAVSQTEHALQSAQLAEAEGAPDSLVVAALLHDVGHILHDLPDDVAEHGIDDCHEEVGRTWLEGHFGPEVTEPVRLHVAAKRYLCAAAAGYHAGLSAASQRSLALQGGPMSADEVARFTAHPHHQAAVRLRHWDDLAKVPGLAVPGLEHYRTRLAAALRTRGAGR